MDNSKYIQIRKVYYDWVLHVKVYAQVAAQPGVPGTQAGRRARARFMIVNNRELIVS